MNLEKSLSRWTEAKLLSPEQADAIRGFEREQPSASWVLYGVGALGITVFMTGVISLIAANWENISPSAKLVLYFLGLGALAWGGRSKG